MWWTYTLQPEWRELLLPSNSTPYERVLSSVDAEAVARLPVQLIAASRSPVECPPPWLAYLAAERSVDEYDSAWTEMQRRAVIVASFDLHKRKGTRRALDLALSPLGFDLRTVEWFENSPRRRPYTFRLVINVTMTGWTRAMRSQVVRVSNATKNAHTLLDEISLQAQVGPAQIFLGAANARHRLIDIGQVPRPVAITLAPHVYFGAAQAFTRSVTVGPRP